MMLISDGRASRAMWFTLLLGKESKTPLNGGVSRIDLHPAVLYQKATSTALLQSKDTGMTQTVRFDVIPVNPGADQPEHVHSLEDKARAIQMADQLAADTGLAHDVVENYVDEETMRLAAKWSEEGKEATVTKSQTIYTASAT